MLGSDHEYVEPTDEARGLIFEAYDEHADRISNLEVGGTVVVPVEGVGGMYISFLHASTAYGFKPVDGGLNPIIGVLPTQPVSIARVCPDEREDARRADLRRRIVKRLRDSSESKLEEIFGGSLEEILGGLDADQT